MNANRHDLEIQLRRVQQNGWLPVFQREAKRAGVTTSRLLALGSRETNLQDIKGDFRGGVYHGFGILQVDIGTDAAWCRQWTKGQVDGGVKRGVDIYLGKVSQIIHHVGQRQLIGNRAFVGKAVDLDDIHRIAAAAYNCGLWAYYHWSRGENCDSTTTGHDYSRDVFDRAVEFADMLDKAGIEVGAKADEIAAQGKYAAGYVARVQLPHAEPQEAEDEIAKADYGRDDSASAAAQPMSDTPAPQNQPDLSDPFGSKAADWQADQPQAPPPTQGAQITQTQTTDASGASSTTTQFAAPAESAPGILDHVNQLGDKFQGLTGTLEKFGIADPLAATSGGTWISVAFKYLLGAAMMGVAFVKDNWEWLVPAVIVLGLGSWLYNESRKRVEKAKAGVPLETVNKIVDASIRT